jgi:hypothetical protein
MAFAQLTCRESLREIESSLRAQAAKLYHLGIRGNVSRNTLANANATRDWRIYADFAQRVTGLARKLYADEPFGVDLTNTAYALDSTTIDLSLSLFPWAPFRTTKAAVKLHQRRQAARRQHPRPADPGSRSSSGRRRPACRPRRRRARRNGAHRPDVCVRCRSGRLSNPGE